MNERVIIYEETSCEALRETLNLGLTRVEGRLHEIKYIYIPRQDPNPEYYSAMIIFTPVDQK